MRPFRSLAVASLVLTHLISSHALAQDEPVSSTTQRISAGTNDPGNPFNNAVVRTSSGCTGTLITPTIVLTSGHCVDDPLNPQRVRPRPAGTTAFSNACNDWQRPDQWYPLGIDYQVFFGNDERNWVATETASFYSLPVCIDMIMLRLDNPVPASVAVPATVSTGLQPRSLGGAPLQITGWGVSGLDDLQVRSANDQSEQWRTTSHANLVTGMASTGGMLFAATEGNSLWRRPADTANSVWEKIGHANRVTAMTGGAGRLFAATSENKLWVRDTRPVELDWEDIGDAPEITAMAMSGSSIFATTRDNRLLARVAEEGPAPWRDVGHANSVVAMAADGGMLYATQASGRLWQRAASIEEEDWQRVVTEDDNQNRSVIRAMTASGGQLFAARRTPDNSFVENVLPIRQTGSVTLGSLTCSGNGPISQPAEFCVDSTGDGRVHFKDSGGPLFFLRAGLPRVLVGVVRQASPANASDFQLFVSTSYNRDGSAVGIANIGRWIDTMAGQTGP